MNPSNKANGQEDKLAFDNLGSLTEKSIRQNKVSGLGPGELNDMSEKEEIAVIIKVAQKGYRPKGLSLSAEINPELFTARLQPNELRRLIADPLVITIEVSRPLHPL